MRMPAFVVCFSFLVAGPCDAGPLSDAAKAGDILELERLIASGADINAIEVFAAPLHWAALNGRPESIDALVAHGANLEVKTDLARHAAACCRPSRTGGSGRCSPAGRCGSQFPRQVPVHAPDAGGARG